MKFMWHQFIRLHAATSSSEVSHCEVQFQVHFTPGRLRSSPPGAGVDFEAGWTISQVRVAAGRLHSTLPEIGVDFEADGTMPQVFH